MENQDRIKYELAVKKVEQIKGFYVFGIGHGFQEAS